jgi:hypothetical protein
MAWSEEVTIGSSNDRDGQALPTPVWLLGLQFVFLVAGVSMSQSFDPIALRVVGWFFTVIAAVCASLYRIRTRNLASLVDYQGLRPAYWRSILHYILLALNAAAIVYVSWRGSLTIPV